MNAPLTAVEPRPRDEGFVIEVQPLSWKRALLLAVGSVAAFHLAYGFPSLSFLIVVFLYCLFQLAALPTPRKAFYFGVVIGYGLCAASDFLLDDFRLAGGCALDGCRLFV